ncbi:PAS domain S-box protein [Colwellia sp. MB3u-4]|uniref:PAS domain S-box protein n=1 Tax=Colwellia sp. MB3u-4 TaxID=2759822 RepID=UPI0015F77985|nr:PAS domain S-box protein [Colwellia sp. MB3u-4]MBA6289250.1 PAS domain S-box protein [Colwellia sp. MB3u-4]
MSKQVFPITKNEQQRIMALKRYAVSDTPSEEVFDRITRLASAFLNVPIALISLVDDSRQWFKSRVGLAAEQTNKDISFFTHTILTDELMIVPDTRLDERFCQSPLVQDDPHIAFYAGAPLKTSDGRYIGTLCAIDTIPRSLNDQQKLILQDLAGMVMDTLASRLVNANVTGKIILKNAAFKTLNQELNLLGQVFNNLDYSILFFDKQGYIKSMNLKTAEIFGYSASETIGQHISIFFPFPYNKLFYKVFDPQINNSDIKINDIPLQLSGLREDGTIFSLELSLTQIKIEQGYTFRVQFQDTTNRDLADKVLEQFKFPLDLSQNFIFIFRESSFKFDYVSQGAIKLSGYSQEELHNMTLCDLDSSINIVDLGNKLTPILAGQQSDITYETTLRRKNKKMISVQIALKIDGDDKIGKRIVVVGTDITERKKNNQAILDNQARLHAIVDNAVDGIITISENGLIETSNRAAEELFGFSQAELKGQNVKILMPYSYAREHDGYLANYKRSGEAKIIGIGREVTGQRKDGSEFPMELSVAEVQLGSARLYTGIVRDMTARKKTEADLLKAMKVADAANKAKSDFLSRMSHELRTPLNAIVGFGEIMQMEPLSAIHKEYTEHILKAGKHLSLLINEVLEIARIEAGQQNLSIEALQVNALIKETWGLMSPMAEKRGIKFSYHDGGNDYYVMADLQRIKQVLLNLLSNAVKYNCRNGTITVTCGESQHDGALHISVQDTGYGIASGDYSRVFEVFERLSADQGTEEGSGVGLALSKALMHAMGGELGLESVLGVGSTFWFELPVGHMANQELLGYSTEISAFTTTEHSRVYNILYIEDNLSNLRLVEALLARRTDLNLTTAIQGNLGIELAFKFLPDLILLDLHLPDIEGDEVLFQLRNNVTTRQIPILILSADATDSQKEKLLAMGANAYITKPLDVRKFITKVDETLRQLP